MANILEQDSVMDREPTIILNESSTLIMIDVMVILIIKEESDLNEIHINNLHFKTTQVIIVLHSNRILIILKLTAIDLKARKN